MLPLPGLEVCWALRVYKRYKGLSSRNRNGNNNTVHLKLQTTTFRWVTRHTKSYASLSVAANFKRCDTRGFLVLAMSASADSNLLTPHRFRGCHYAPRLWSTLKNTIIIAKIDQPSGDWNCQLWCFMMTWKHIRKIWSCFYEGFVSCSRCSKGFYLCAV